MEAKDARRYLRKAARIMEERGLNKGYYESYSGKVCAYGAVSKAKKGLSYIQVQSILESRLDEADLIWFNDKWPRTSMKWPVS